MLIRWYAGAAAAAGTTEEPCDAPGATVRATLLALHPDLGAVLDRCTFLADGARVRADEPVPAGTATLDVLPPFAGG